MYVCDIFLSVKCRRAHAAYAYRLQWQVSERRWHQWAAIRCILGPDNSMKWRWRRQDGPSGSLRETMPRCTWRTRPGSAASERTSSSSSLCASAACSTPWWPENRDTRIWRNNRFEVEDKFFLGNQKKSLHALTYNPRQVRMFTQHEAISMRASQHSWRPLRGRQREERQNLFSVLCVSHL